MPPPRYKSTGPRTPEGKARSSQNARKHGLTSTSAIQPGEDPQAFVTFYHAMLADLDPQTELESLLAVNLIHAAWKCQRLDDAEAGILQAELQRLEAEDEQKWQSQCEHNARCNLPQPPKPSHKRTTSDVYADAPQPPLSPPPPHPPPHDFPPTPPHPRPHGFPHHAPPALPPLPKICHNPLPPPQPPIPRRKIRSPQSEISN